MFRNYKNLSNGLLSIIVFFTFSGCSKSPGAPGVFDGFYLEYEFESGDLCRLTFNEFEEGKFRVTKTPENCGFNTDGYSAGKDLVFDKYMKSQDDRYVFWGSLAGEYSMLWLPENIRKPGTHKVAWGRYVLTGPKTWQEWTVLEVSGRTALLAASSYYDAETGYLVGFEKEFVGDRNLIFKLKNTNAQK